MLRRHAMYAAAAVARSERPDGTQIARFLRLGLPAGLAILVEVTSFTLMALFIARQGAWPRPRTRSLPTWRRWSMVPLSLAIATSARVSYWRGAGDERARPVPQPEWFWPAALMGCALAATLCNSKATDCRAVLDQPGGGGIGASLLVWVAAYQVATRCRRCASSAAQLSHHTPRPWWCMGCCCGWGLHGGYRLAYQGWLAGAVSPPAPSGPPAPRPWR